MSSEHVVLIMSVLLLHLLLLFLFNNFSFKTFKLIDKFLSSIFKLIIVLSLSSNCFKYKLLLFFKYSIDVSFSSLILFKLFISFFKDIASKYFEFNSFVKLL